MVQVETIRAGSAKMVFRPSLPRYFADFAALGFILFYKAARFERDSNPRSGPDRSLYRTPWLAHGDCDPFDYHSVAASTASGQVWKY